MGRLAHFLVNWQKMTENQWILNTMKGYQIYLWLPHQEIKPHPSHFNSDQRGWWNRRLGNCVTKGGDGAINCTPRLFSLYTLFLVPKDGSQRPVIKPQLFSESSTFQNGRYSYHEKPPVCGGLASENQSQRCILLYPNYQCTSQEVPVFLGRKETLPIQLPPIWPSVSSLGLYQNPKVGHDSWSRAGDVLGNGVHRQHLAHGGVQKESTRPGKQSDIPNELHGVHSEQRKTTTEPSQTLEFLGFMVNTRAMELYLPPVKIKQIWAES